MSTPKLETFSITAPACGRASASTINIRTSARSHGRQRSSQVQPLVPCGMTAAASGRRQRASACSRLRAMIQEEAMAAGRSNSSHGEAKRNIGQAAPF